jgi:hypothetical protein
MPIFSFLLRPEHHVDRKALKLKNPNVLCTFECNITTKTEKKQKMVLHFLLALPQELRCSREEA